MAALDYLKKKAQAGLEAGVKTLARLKPAVVTTGGAAPAGIDYTAYDRPTASLGSDGKAVQNRVPSAPLDGVKPPPVTAPAVQKPPGMVRGAINTAKATGKFLGAAALPVTTAVSAVNSYNTPTEDFAARLGETGGESFGKDLGIRAAGTLADIGNTLTLGVADRVGNLIAGNGFNRSGGPGYEAPAAAPTAPAVAAPVPTAAAAPAAVQTAAPVVPSTQQLTPQEVRGLNTGTINAAEYAPGTAGTGFVTNSEGRGTRFNAQPVQTAQPELSNTDTALARLRDQASSPERYGQGRAAKAAEALITYETNLAKNATDAAKVKATASGADATLQDKRAKEFYDQFVNNAFSLPPDDKGVSRPDSAKNNQFLDFARENSPHFQTAEGQASLFALPSQEQNKIISELRAKFVTKDNVEAAQNDKSFFQKPGISSKQVVTTGARESNAGDIPDIGLGNYLYSNVPYTNPNVVTTDRGAVLAEDFIGDPAQEGSYDRREEFTKLLKRGVQRGKVQ